VGRGVRGVRDEMSTDKKERKTKTKRRNALVVCRDGKEFWTTQKQFWQWVREGVVAKTGDSPLSGEFLREHEELTVVVSNTLLNLARPRHMSEALRSRRAGLGKR
jgi:hypothetical protein